MYIEFVVVVVVVEVDVDVDVDVDVNVDVDDVVDVDVVVGDKTCFIALQKRIHFNDLRHHKKN